MTLPITHNLLEVAIRKLTAPPSFLRHLKMWRMGSNGFGEKRLLSSIIDNIDAVRIFTAGMTFEDFERDRKTVYAVTRALEIISEASRRLPDELKNRPASTGRVWLRQATCTATSMRWSTMLWTGTRCSMA